MTICAQCKHHTEEGEGFFRFPLLPGVKSPGDGCGRTPCISSAATSTTATAPSTNRALSAGGNSGGKRNERDQRNTY
jgi:hypothetical protein